MFLSNSNCRYVCSWSHLMIIPWCFWPRTASAPFWRGMVAKGLSELGRSLLGRSHVVNPIHPDSKPQSWKIYKGHHWRFHEKIRYGLSLVSPHYLILEDHGNPFKESASSTDFCRPVSNSIDFHPRNAMMILTWLIHFRECQKTTRQTSVAPFIVPFVHPLCLMFITRSMRPSSPEIWNPSHWWDGIVFGFCFLEYLNMWFV